MRFNQKTALAFHFACSSSEIEWYQPTTSGKTKLFSSGDNYYCASNGKPLPKGFEWFEQSDYILNQSGWHIYAAPI